MREEEIFPLPEILDPGPWKIFVSSNPGGGINAKERFMEVPSGSTDHEAFVRLHEMAHLKWSPAEPLDRFCKLLNRFRKGERLPQRKMLSLVVHNGIEDCRINGFLAKLGFDINCETPPLVLAYIRGVLQKHYPCCGHVILCSSLAASIDRPLVTQELIATAKLALIPDSRIKWAIETAEFIKRQLIRNPTYEQVVELVDYLLKDPLSPCPEEPGVEVATLLGFPPNPDNQWGKMIIATPPLPIRVPLRKGAVKLRRSMDEGVRFRDVNRYLVDKAIFRGNKIVPKISLLIDRSGSMSRESTFENIHACIHRFPASIIAFYQGGINGDMSRGCLHIVGKQGRIAAREYLSRSWTGGNVVDGPALEWLAKQVEPRFWVSDGQVTGIREMVSQTMSDWVKQHNKRHRIQRLHTFTELYKHTGF